MDAMLNFTVEGLRTTITFTHAHKKSTADRAGAFQSRANFELSTVSLIRLKLGMAQSFGWRSATGNYHYFLSEVSLLYS